MTALSMELPLLTVRTNLRLVPAPLSAPPYDDDPRTATVLRLVAPIAVAPVLACLPSDEAWLVPGRTATAELPPSRAHAGRLIQAVLEVVAGVRPLTQLRREVTPELYASLSRTLCHRPRTVGARPGGGAVRSLHVQERPEGIVEACATVQLGARVSAYALRLEGLEGRWKCTELAGV